MFQLTCNYYPFIEIKNNVMMEKNFKCLSCNINGRLNRSHIYYFKYWLMSLEGKANTTCVPK